MFGTMGLPEILIILVIGIVVFGVIKMPKIVRSLGSGVKQFQKFRNVVKNPLDHIDDFMEDEPAQDQQQYYGPNPDQQQYYGPNPDQQQYNGPNPDQQQYYGPNPNQQPGAYPGQGQQGQWQGGSPQGSQGSPGEPEEGGEQKPPERDSGDA
ncbi:MAG: twin-arginine translocase TatA/TatE family subunit [Spirochaetota bacterium]|nr:MAG: twin-arginine translocase TatA/TatE family subunit [Spirochaetota bacterium]